MSLISFNYGDSEDSDENSVLEILNRSNFSTDMILMNFIKIDGNDQRKR